ncbi:YbhB/YbcL family Raf kinase inhibitor-like protein [Nonomuraea sp. NPDC050556]|uniref:YbhB/YbcL family Raf kinase inhibitor-like protein n=1 Tax=Nonomuraea sp. NPDC050556 TaxID=3364369 RepID=UPI0037B2FF1A
MGLRNTAKRVRLATVVAAVSALSFVVCGCSFIGGRPAAAEIAEVHVDSPQLRDGKPLPREFSCKGKGTSPPLRWSTEPLSAAKSIAIVVDDSSASGAAVHWVIYNIDPRTTLLGEDASSDPPPGSSQARVTSGKAGYQPPCQDKGNYRVSVYVLNGRVPVKSDRTLREILQDVATQTIARGRLTAVDIE